MHLTDNIPTFLETLLSAPHVYWLVVGFILFFGPFILFGVKAHHVSKKNAALESKYKDDMKAFNLLSRRERASKEAPKVPTYLNLEGIVQPFSFPGLAVFIGFTCIIATMVTGSVVPAATVVSNIQQEAKRVYNLHLTSDEAKQLSSTGGRDASHNPVNSVLEEKDGKADYIQFGSLATGVKKDGETKVLKITLVKIDGEYKLVYEGKTGLSTVQEIPKT